MVTKKEAEAMSKQLEDFSASTQRGTMDYFYTFSRENRQIK
jgi:hypothetical protein